MITFVRFILFTVRTQEFSPDENHIRTEISRERLLRIYVCSKVTRNSHSHFPHRWKRGTDEFSARKIILACRRRGDRLGFLDAIYREKRKHKEYERTLSTTRERERERLWDIYKIISYLNKSV